MSILICGQGPCHSFLCNDRTAAFKHFFYEDRVFTVINPGTVESLPGICIDDPVYNLTCADMRKALIACAKAPEMAYMLKRRTIESAFLDRLQWENRYIPIVRCGSGYSLREDVRDAWNTLEQTFLVISNALFQTQIGNPEATLPFDCHWPLPMDCGYLRVHSNAHQARRAAVRARDACILLLARCTMALALCMRPNEEPPMWILILSQQGVPPSFIDLVRTSIIADFSPGLRAGAFIDPSGVTAWINHVPCMVRANLPVYIMWPKDVRGILEKHPFLRPYRPTASAYIPTVVAEDDTQCHLLRFRWIHVPKPSGPVPWRPLPPTAMTIEEQAREEVTSWETLVDPETPSRGPSTAEDADPLLEPPHGPGQRPGETHQQFFARRRAMAVGRDSEADEIARAACEERKRKARAYVRPVRPTTVYLWTIAGDVDPDLPEEWLEVEYRQYVPFKAVGDLWGRYPDSHKVYDEWANEWDICPDLSDEQPLEEADLYDDDDDDYDDEKAVVSGAHHSFQPTSFPAGQVAMSGFYESHLRWFYEDNEDYTHPSGRLRPALEAFPSLARFRYGIIPERVEGSHAAYAQFSEPALKKIFGLVEEYMDDAARSILPSASGFAAAYLSDPSKAAPGWIGDFNPTSRYYLGIVRRNDIALNAHVLDGSRWWRVRYRESEDLWWSVFVDDTTVLELWRREGVRNVRDVCSLLLHRGSHFRIAYKPSRRDAQGFVLQSPKPVFLGWRSPDFRPDGWDFKAYETRAIDVLSAPRGRAALLHGGIIWRIAVELLGQGGLSDVLRGPSADIWRHGREVHEDGGKSWYEDALTTYELDVISGVYKVYTGETHPRSQSMCKNLTSTQVEATRRSRMYPGGPRVIHGPRAAWTWDTGRRMQRCGSKSVWTSSEATRRGQRQQGPGRTTSR